MSFALGAIKEDARVRNEQDADINLKIFNAKLSLEEHDKQLLKIDTKAQKLLKNENKTIIKERLLLRSFYGECGQVTHSQIILPTQIFPQLAKPLHGPTAKHPGFTRKIQQCRAKYYHPRLARNNKNWVATCQERNKYKRINTRQIRPKIINTHYRILNETRRHTRD